MESVCGLCGTVTYTPDNGFTGADSFTYTVQDNAASPATSNAATVSPLGIWSLALRNSLNIPAQGDTLRIDSTGGARLVQIRIRD